MNAQRLETTGSSIFLRCCFNTTQFCMELAVSFCDEGAFARLRRSLHEEIRRVGKAKRAHHLLEVIACVVGTLRFAHPTMLKRRVAHPSNTASAPFTASALSVTVFSSEPACTVTFSAKNRATVT
jgi:hypothetical protein